MNGIERVKNAVRHVKGAPVARGELVLDRQFARIFMDWQNSRNRPRPPGDTDMLIACCRGLQLDLVCIQSAEATSEAVEPPIGIRDIGRFSDEGLFVFWIVDGVFQRAVQRLGMMEILTRIGRSPDAVRQELTLTTDPVISSMIQGVTAGAHGIIIADDIAYNRGTLMSPGFIEHYLLPFWKLQVMQAGELDVPVFFHSDGNLNQVMPHIVAAGFDGLQCIESAAGMDMREISARYGQSICLMGGLNPALLFQAESQKGLETARIELDREIERLMASATGSGGFIFGTSSGISADMSPELVQHAYRRSFDYEPSTGQYPSANPQWEA